MGFQEDFNELKKLDEDYGVKRDFIADALVDDEAHLVMVVNAAKKIHGEDAQTYKLILADAIIYAFTCHMDSVLDEMRQLDEGTIKGPSHKQEQAEWERDFRRENGR